MRRVPFALLGISLLVACGDGQTQEQAEARPDSVALALEQFDTSVFDSITWNTDTARINRGAVVWTFSCRKCHGEVGHGDAGFVIAGDTLVPPDFAEPGWRLATDRLELMKYIYAGNQEGMPHWGIQGLKPRDIDAVSTYIQELLVPQQPPPPTTTG